MGYYTGGVVGLIAVDLPNKSNKSLLSPFNCQQYIKGFSMELSNTSAFNQYSITLHASELICRRLVLPNKCIVVIGK